MLKRLCLAILFAVVGLGLTSAQPEIEAGSSFVNSKSHDGEELAADLPGARHIKNIGSKLDGAGMCVFSSAEMASDWQGMLAWRGFRDWCAAKYPGGGDPEKIVRLIKAYAAAKGLPMPQLVQYTGENPEPILELCEKTGRMACITYGYSPRYGAYINHMVNCVHFGPKFGTVLDNNFPGEDSYEWMEKGELVRRIKLGADRFGRAVKSPAWVFVWLNPAPPPAPRNFEGLP